MNYRAVALGLLIEGHPVQAYFSDLAQAHRWARTVSNDNKVNVHIFQTYERVVKRVRPVKRKKEKSDA